MCEIASLHKKFLSLNTIDAVNANFALVKKSWTNGQEWETIPEEDKDVEQWVKITREILGGNPITYSPSLDGGQLSLGSPAGRK